MENFSEEGFFVIWRRIKEWKHFKDVNTCYVFIFHLLLNARHKDGYTKTGIYLKRGQVLTSINRIIRESDNYFSVQNIRTILNKLEKSNEIIKTTTTNYTIITITNYDKYQNYEQYNNYQNILTNNLNNDNNNLRGIDNKQVTNYQQTGNKQVTTYNNDNNDNNVNKSLSCETKKENEITEEERERLINYFNNKRGIENPRGYVDTIIKNGDYKKVLEELEQKKIQAQKQAEQTTTYTPSWKNEDFEPATPEQVQACMEKLKEKLFKNKTKKI